MQTALGGAGLAVAFNAPIGGTLFTLEEVTKSFRVKTVLATLFSAAGIDFDQWTALTLVAVKLDFRGSALNQRQQAREVNVIISVILQAIFYTMFGGI